MSIDALNCGNLLHRRRQDAHQHRGDRQVAAGLRDLLLVLLAQLLERGDVGLVELRDVRNGVPRVAEMLGRSRGGCWSTAWRSTSPHFEKSGSGSRRARTAAGADAAGRADAAQDPPRVFLDVFLRDAAVGPVPSTSLMSTPISRARRRTAGDAGAARPSVASRRGRRGRRRGRRLGGLPHGGIGSDLRRRSAAGLAAARPAAGGGRGRGAALGAGAGVGGWRLRRGCAAAVAGRRRRPRSARPRRP